MRRRECRRGTQHDAIEVGELAGGGEKGVRTCVFSCHNDLGGAQAQVEGVERCEVREQIVARGGHDAVEQTVGLVAPGMLAGEHREPDQVLGGERVGIRSGVVGGGARPHHEVFGIVRGEKVAAGGGIGIVAIKRA